MLILALDTTSRAGSIAIVRDGVVLHEFSGDASRTHGERLPLEFAHACRAAGVELRDVNLFAVAAGPGSFTGLRVGIAAIQGLAVAFDRRVVPVSTLAAVAYSAPADPDRRIGAWVDAHRGEVFAQLFEAGDDPQNPMGIRTPLTEPVSAPPEQVIDLWLEEWPVKDITFHGDGAVRYAERIRAVRGASSEVADVTPPLAGVIGRIAASEPDRAVLPHAIVPVYVRRPDAERARDRRQTSS